MPLLNFKPQFVEPIRSGRKHHTIRATRAIPVKRGDNLYLYTGLRHKGAFRILADPVVCTQVQIIYIEIDDNKLEMEIIVDGHILESDEIDRLAIADGFKSFPEFSEFWMKNHGVKGRVDFKGQIIHWK